MRIYKTILLILFLFLFYQISWSTSNICWDQLVLLPPTNDACINAEVVTNQGSVSGTILESTNVEGLSPCQNVGDCSSGTESAVDFGEGVWFVYTSSSAEDIIINTEGSSFDTQLQVFTGTCGNLTCLGGDDDGAPFKRSKMCFTSTASASVPVDYYIYLDGFFGDKGDYVLNINPVVLPITLLSFEAEKINKTNLLTWITGTEDNTESHLIERSDDGKNWEVIGELAAVGFSDTQQKYEFIDDKPLSLSYYRLRSVDFDDTYQISNVVSLERLEKGFFLSNIFPNPTSETLSIVFNSDQFRKVEIKVSDLTGRTMYIIQNDAQDGLNYHEFDLSDLNPGIYIVSLNNGTTQLTKRISKI